MRRGNGYKAEQARDGPIATIKSLRPHLRRLLTRDQGPDLARHAEIKIAAGIDIYFCDPAAHGSAAAQDLVAPMSSVRFYRAKSALERPSLGRCTSRR